MSVFKKMLITGCIILNIANLRAGDAEEGTPLASNGRPTASLDQLRIPRDAQRGRFEQSRSNDSLACVLTSCVLCSYSVTFLASAIALAAYTISADQLL